MLLERIWVASGWSLSTDRVVDGSGAMTGGSSPRPLQKSALQTPHPFLRPLENDVNEASLARATVEVALQRCESIDAKS